MQNEMMAKLYIWNFEHRINKILVSKASFEVIIQFTKSHVRKFMFPIASLENMCPSFTRTENTV